MSGESSSSDSISNSSVSSSSVSHESSSSEAGAEVPPIGQEKTIPRGPFFQWLVDRVDGDSKVGDGRPYCFLCVPPAFLKYAPRLFEMNGCCVVIGRIGYYETISFRWRRIITNMALTLDAMSLCLFVFACLAMSDSSDLLKVASWAVGDVRVSPADTSANQNNLGASIYVGLRSIVVDANSVATVIPFEDFCDLTTDGQLRQVVKNDDCNKCEDVSYYLLVLPLLIACGAFAPSIAADIIRNYDGYDVNCQRFAAFLSSAVSLAGAALAWSYFAMECLDSFYSGSVIFGADGNVAVSSLSATSVGSANYDWKYQAGLICLIVGISFKVFVILSHSMVPTPTITRNPKEQYEYELMRRTTDDELNGNESSSEYSSDSDPETGY